MEHPVITLVGIKRRALCACENYLRALEASTSGALPVSNMLSAALLRLQRVNTAKRPKLLTLDDELLRCETILAYLLGARAFTPREDAIVRAAMLALAEISGAWPYDVEQKSLAS